MNSFAWTPQLPLSLQPKLCAFCRNKSSNVWAAAARTYERKARRRAHRDLPYMVKRGEFRSDLYYRLNVFPVELRPLRERREDMRQLVAHLLSYFPVALISTSTKYRSQR